MTAEAPETHFTRSAGRSVAFQVCGESGPDLIFTPGSFNHVDVWWEHPITATFLRSLASFSRLILFDRRGTGASDPLPSDELPDWRDWLADLRAVLDAVGSERAAIFASLDGGPTALSFAAEAPDRVTKLVLYNTAARYRAADDYPCGVSDEATEALITSTSTAWGTERFSAANYPERGDDAEFLRWYAKYQRASVGKGRVGAVMRAWFDVDARNVVGRVRAPTLVLQRERYRLVPETHGRWLADHLPDARFVGLPGSSALFAPDAPLILDHVSRFLTGNALEARPPGEPTGRVPRVPGYALVELVGRGGMGEVWEARKDVSGERVAIKLIRMSPTKELRRRLLREAEATSAVQHPALVTILEVIEASDGSPALVMELLEGESLADRLERRPSLGMEESVSLLLTIVSAIGAAHEVGIVHRDLKPGNVFLANIGDEVVVKVLDFGIARVLGEDPAVTRLTTTGALLGTPAYMSPEQLFGEAFDHRADIWALGIMAFEVLTSVLPTRGANVGQILKVLMGGTSWKASDVVPAVPEAVSDIVAKMLSRAPDARPADLREVFDVLSQHSTRLEPRFGPPMSRSAERAAQRSG